MASYKIKSGDTVSQIAKRMGVRIQDIVAANPNLKDVNKIRIGQSLNIPAARKGKNIGSQGPYGRTSKTEMNMMRGDGEAYTRGVRAKMNAGAETSATPKLKQKTLEDKIGTVENTKKRAMALPKPKPKKKTTRSMSGLSAGDVAAKDGGSLSAAQKGMINSMAGRKVVKSGGMIKRKTGGGMGCGAALRGYGAVRGS